MDCSAFRRHHVAFVDDTLPGDVLVAAVRHVAECPACARHDAAVRRSLLLARNVCGGQRLECSPDFAQRLEARLRAGNAEGPVNDDWVPRWWELAGTQIGERLGGRRARQGLAAAAMLAAVSTGAMLRGRDSAGQLQGLGGGVLPPFAAPFTAGSTGAPPAPTAGEVVAGAGEFAAGAAAETGDADLVVYDETIDAGAVVAPAAVGVPVWAAAVLAGEVPVALWRGAGASSVQLIRVGY